MKNRGDIMDKEIKSAVKELKDSIEYRSEHMRLIEYFKDMIVQYFKEKYDFHVRVLTGVTWFAIEKDLNYYYGNDRFIMSDFQFTSKVLYDFCQLFGCEFTHTACDGDRYFFTFDDVDMSNAFIMG